MTTPIVVEYLKNNSLTKLDEEYGIETSATVGGLFFSLNYSQIRSEANQMANECRGLILAVNSPLTEEQVSGNAPLGDCKVLAYPFSRFFNQGDSNAANVDFNDKSTVFWEKLDGTCCIVYFNTVTGCWEVATRSVPLANKKMDGYSNHTFRTLFEKALFETLLSNGFVGIDSNPKVVFNVWTKNLDKECTYVFELTTPDNRIVVYYPNYRIHLLGIRNIVSGKEAHIPDMLFGVKACPSHRLSNLEEVLNFVGSKPPTEQEGLVVMDSHFRRVKLKSLAYTAYNKIRDRVAKTPRAVLELLLLEKLDDVLPMLEPHLKDEALVISNKFKNLVNKNDLQVHSILSEVKNRLETAKVTGISFNERKEVALLAKERNAWLSPLMDIYCGKAKSTLDWILNKKIPSTNDFSDSFLDSIYNML